MTRVRALLVPIALLAISACSFRNVACGVPKPEETAAGAQAPAAQDSPAAPRGSDSTFQIVFLGDSLTAGFGLLSDQAFPPLVQNRFAAEGYTEVETVNAGVTGDTSAGGVRRVESLLGPSTRILVVALGGNDALRGLTPTETHDNLVTIIDTAREKRVAVLLCGMEAPTNFGEDYRERFRGIFLELAREYKGSIAIMPFLLEGVAGNPAFNQADGIHPNVEGAKIIADQIYPRLRTMKDSMG